MKSCWLAVFFLFLGWLPAVSQEHTHSASSASNSNWVLTWSDEFNGPNGSAPDPTKWIAEIGGNGWGNKELQYYTPRRENVRQENGNLVIEAIKEKFTGSDRIARSYTSARLKTQGLFAQRYGRFEARIKVADGKGTWSAFWLLGDDFSKVGWPACGEIDIMEIVGVEPAVNRCSLHGPGHSGGNSLTTVYSLPAGRFSNDFHIFATEWEPRAVRFYVDDQLYDTKTPADISSDKGWVFDHPFLVILNLAVGGSLAGIPDDSRFPQRMLVDYVRVYSPRAAASTGGANRKLNPEHLAKSANPR